MADNDSFDTRAEVLGILMDKVTADTYPSETMLDLIEELARPDDIPAYASVLADKVRADTYPSTSMLRRLVALAG